MPDAGCSYEFDTRSENILWCAAAIGLFGINGLFVYSFFAHPEQVKEAQANLYALGFYGGSVFIAPAVLFFDSNCKAQITGLDNFSGSIIIR